MCYSHWLILNKLNETINKININWTVAIISIVIGVVLITNIICCTVKKLSLKKEKFEFLKTQIEKINHGPEEDGRFESLIAALENI